MSGDVSEKLAEIVAAVLDITTTDVTDDLSATSLEAWDSFRHLTLILAVEDAFNVSFEETRIPSLNSFHALRLAVAEKLDG